METQKDKFKATWLSHSSIGDFLKCPRLYYLHNVYKDLRTNHKITITNAALTLGQVVHSVIESLSEIPVEDRFSVSPLIKFENDWKKVTGQTGGSKMKRRKKNINKRESK